jgi:3D (Asp-Asp-Asp) domain-containing protein
LDAPVQPATSDEQPHFGGRPLRKVRTLRMQVTAYSPDELSCGKWADGITASGYSVQTNGMKLAAADTSLLPFKSMITVPGYNGSRPIPVLDRGGKIKGHRLDVLYPTHQRALKWGIQWLDVDVWEYAD